MEYRSWLQQQSQSHSDANTRAQANALLQKVGDDFKLDQGYLDNMFSIAFDRPGGYGKQTMINLNDTFKNMYNADMQKIKESPIVYADDGSSQILGSSTGAPRGGGAALPALNQAAINNTQIALDQLPAILQAAIAAEQTRKANTIRGFDDQEQGQRETYDTSTVTNQQNYDSNYMDSIRSGIKGLGGLFNILRGTGAAGGTAQDQVRDVVGGVTAADIRGGADTQQANQTALDSALSNFLTEIKGKRQMAEDTFANNESAIRRDNLSQQQDLFSKMASYYSDGGRTGEATNWMNRAGSLTPDIARNSMAKQSSYDTSPVAVKAPELAAFSAPTQPDVAVATPDQVGAGIFTMNRKKEQREQVPVALPAGA